MFKQSGSGWLVVIVLLTLVLGLTGGGVMGGIAGYYVARTQAVVTVPAGRAVLTAQVPAQVPTATAGQTSTAAPSGIEDMVQKASPGVVTIVTTQPTRPRRFNPNSIPVTAEGSGMIVDDQGHIVTNAHVVQAATQIQVILSNGESVSADLIGAD
ncbi:MAG: trypsin-like peptidase domain-containing protein, partial [Rudaea sp.]